MILRNETEETAPGFCHLRHNCSVSLFLLHLCFESGEVSTKLSGLYLSEEVVGERECGSFFGYSFDLDH